MMQFFLSLFITEKGSTGKKEKIAPIGQRKRQKNLGSAAMPAVITKKRSNPSILSGVFSACNRENTVTGLCKDTIFSIPFIHARRTKIRTTYFPYRSIFPHFLKICSGFFLHFFRSADDKTYIQSP